MTVEEETEVAPAMTPEELKAEQELAFWTWGLTGQPVSWAPTTWQFTVAAIRRANTGEGDVAAVQSALDADFPDAGYEAANVTLAHPPVGLFTATVTDDSVRLDLDGDQDLMLPDENVVWHLGDGTVVSDAGGLDHTYEAPGTYQVRMEVLVAGTVYTESETIVIGDEEPEVEPTLDPAVAARAATVFESESDDLPNHNAIVAGEPEDDEAEEYDPSEHTVDEVLAYAAEHPDEVERIAAAEDAGKQRVGILDKL